MNITQTAPTGMTTKAIGPFLAIAFGLTWGLAALLTLFYDQIVAIFGEIGYTNPLFILAVSSRLGNFFRRLTLWRAPMAWWLFLILGIPAIFYAGAVVKGTLGTPFPFSPWYQVLPALALALLIGPIEEFGWRGVALPLLQRKFAPFWAGLILGVIWAGWHIPAFLLSGTPQSNWSFVPYFTGVVAICIILTPIFNAARGSLLIPVIFHFQMNNPLWPDAQPWDTLLFVLVAVIVVWLNRRRMFRREDGVTAVLMPEESGVTEFTRIGNS
jgi:uncharacterized protein